jgi:hypothetical protein
MRHGVESYPIHFLPVAYDVLLGYGAESAY